MKPFATQNQSFKALKPLSGTIALLLIAGSTWAQTVISGKVLEPNGKPVRGASVSLDQTIDGGTTDSTGNFRFTTEEKGAQTLMATEPGHEPAGMPITISGNMDNLLLKMKAVHKLDDVVITAGSFEASSDKNKAALTTLDILTTAGANADPIKALQTLPGTQQTGTQTGLFVRGGDASEAATIIDEIIVQNAFFSSAPGVAARSRFLPTRHRCTGYRH